VSRRFPHYAIIAITVAALQLTPSAAALSDGVAVPLFQKDRSGHVSPVPDYDRAVADMKPGTRIQFSNGQQYRLGQKLGAGDTTAIYELADHPEWAIRIPLSRIGLLRSGLTDPEHLTSYIKGSQLLEKAGAPIVHVHESLAGEFAIVDRVNIGRSGLKATLKDFVYGYFPPSYYTPEKKRVVQTALENFARKTAAFERIGDLHESQLLYDFNSDEWILADWSESHKLANLSHPDAGNVMSALLSSYVKQDGHEWRPLRPSFAWVAEVMTESNKIIPQERAALLCGGRIQAALKTLLKPPPAPKKRWRFFSSASPQ
jgi:hypothetical protein